MKNIPLTFWSKIFVYSSFHTFVFIAYVPRSFARPDSYRDHAARLAKRVENILNDKHHTIRSLREASVTQSRQKAGRSLIAERGMGAICILRKVNDED